MEKTTVIKGAIPKIVDHDADDGDDNDDDLVVRFDGLRSAYILLPDGRSVLSSHHHQRWHAWIRGRRWITEANIHCVNHYSTATQVREYDYTDCKNIS